jgi:lipopolysaccharide transport system ATP-binding protein
MSDFAIRVEGLGKRFRIARARRPTMLREALMEGLRSAGGLLAGRRSAEESFWALRDVSFEVPRGQAVAIVGGNGAGKSTLLRILSRITEPTTGDAWIRGRVGSLLEVGTGFHAELTGRENTYLNGAILGMKRAEIDRKFDEIVAFAGVERFVDTPVKHYSSGMYLRLAFAVAAHLEPEILVVDEVLAVGDAAFQKKCLGKMGEVAREGRTVLFVSHNMPAVRGLCERAIWLRDGAVVDQGEAGAVVSRYLRHAVESTVQRAWPDMEDAPGNDEFRLRAARVRPADGVPGDPIDVRTPALVEIEYWNLQPGARMDLSLRAYDEGGTLIFDAGPPVEPRPLPAGLYRDVCRIPGDLLNDGLHTLELRVFRDREAVVFEQRDLLVVHVADAPDLRGGWFGKWPGAVRPLLPWTTEPLRESPQEPAARSA